MALVARRPELHGGGGGGGFGLLYAFDKIHLVLFKVIFIYFSLYIYVF